jgi:hypothetical protein
MLPSVAFNDQTMGSDIPGLGMKFLALTLVVLAGALNIQAHAAIDAAPTTGQVTGSVWCRDSGKPARFASIQLVPEKAFSAAPVEAMAAGSAPDAAHLKMEALTSALKSALKNIFDGSDLQTLTGLDGTFQLDKVPAGTYYVISQLQGYRSPLSTLSQQERMQPDAATFAGITSQTQKIVLAPGQTIQTRIELDRGATLSGRITYSDGSAARNVTPALLLRAKDGGWTQVFTSALPVPTDDQGAFHFLGLPAGQYAVKASLPTEQMIIGVGLGQMSTHMATGDALVVYSGGASREADIKPIELAEGASRTEISLTFPLTGLHTISGIVVAAPDRHPVNTGTIELQEAGNASPLRTLQIKNDGTFVLHYVLDGAYVLKVNRAADTQAPTDGTPCPIRCKEIRRYQPVSMPVTVKDDVSAVTLMVSGTAADQ